MALVAPLLAGALVSGAARADGQARDVPSVFFVAKSENRNQVHYGVHLDASCAPVGAQPLYAYWRMLEHGPHATEPLLSREVPAYGIAEQRVLERTAGGGRVLIRLNALPGRAIVITTGGHDGACEASATTVIDGTRASLRSVYAKLRWPFGVDYLLLSGRSLADGRALEEKLAG